MIADSRLWQIRSLATEADKIAAELQDELQDVPTPSGYGERALSVVRESLARALVWVDKAEAS